MFQFSDSDSIDSDEGIRFKTDSIRNKTPTELRKKSRSTCRSRLRSRSPRRKDYHGSSRKRDKSRESKKSPDLRSSGSRKHEKHSRHKTSDKTIKKIENKLADDSSGHTSSTIEERHDEKIVEYTQKTKPKELVPESMDNKNVCIGPALPPHMQNKNADEKSDAICIGPVLPPIFKKNDEEECETLKEEVCFGPSLPPQRQSNQTEINEDKIVTIGPVIPLHLREKLTQTTIVENAEAISDEEGCFGPLPEGFTNSSKTQIALEERAIQLRMDQLDSDANTNQPIREEWMLELPQTKSANFGLGPRQFRSKIGPDLSDRSSWTETPEDKEKRRQGKLVEKVDLKKETELKEIQRRDKEQERMAKKHKKHKDSLLDIHTKKRKKEKKDDVGPTERRPFNRDTDLQVNRFDEAQKKAILKKAQLLDDRFSRGQSKFL